MKSPLSYDLLPVSAEKRMKTYYANSDDACSLLLSMKRFESLLRDENSHNDDSPNTSREHQNLPKPFTCDEMPLIEEMPSAEHRKETDNQLATFETGQSKEVDFDISSTN